ncbi:MAG TPA: hypothetical protein VK868_00290 [Pyrinomonadaceae bacterium]|nr:hypothetical protein [Pyrinomonadaceae bacterium]
MNRNQKIALGCGGAGCLGLIVVAIAGGLIYYFMMNAATNRNYNFNVSTNRNSNSNDNSDFTTNSNSNDNDNSSNSNTSSSSSSSSLSDDDKHKLYQAAAMTGDAELVRRVSVKLGLLDEDYTPGENYQSFLTAHVTWVMRNGTFIQSINSPEKARAYVNENFPE